MLGYPATFMMFLFIAAQLQDIHVALYKSQGTVAPVGVLTISAILRLTLAAVGLYVAFN